MEAFSNQAGLCRVKTLLSTRTIPQTGGFLDQAGAGAGAGPEVKPKGGVDHTVSLLSGF